MLLLLFSLSAALLLYFLHSTRHPSGFPPGPRTPLPLVGDQWRLTEPMALTSRRLKEVRKELK